MLFLSLVLMQSDEHCCNSCEEVREAYRKKGWAMTNMDLIDQVGFTLFVLHIEHWNILVTSSTLRVVDPLFMLLIILI